MLIPLAAAGPDTSILGRTPISARSGVDLFNELPLFSGLTEGEWAAAAQDFSRRRFYPGQAVFYQGDPGCSVYVIELDLIAERSS